MYSADRSVHRRPWLHLRSHNLIIREVVNHIFYQASFCWCLREETCHFMDMQSTMACIYTYNVFYILYTKWWYSSHDHQRNWIYFTFIRDLKESWIAATIYVNLLESLSIDIGKYIICMHLGSILVSKGKFDWAVRCVIIFLYAQFWIRLGTVSYRGKKVRTVDSPAVRSVNKSRDTRNCVRNEPKYAICVLVATRLYYKSLGIILNALI